MNKYTLALLLGTAAAHNKNVDVKQVEEIVGGFLKGALDAEGFDDINKCIQDGEHIITDVEDAVQHFEKKDAKDIIAGLEDLADLIKQVKAGMSDCSHLKADWAKLEQMAAIFSSPTSFAYHVGKDIMVNGVQIFHEIETAVSDYKSQQWSDFGYQIGEATAKTLVGSGEQLSQMEKQNYVAEVFRGVLEAFGGHFNIEALLVCIKDEDMAALLLDEAYQSLEAAIKTKDYTNLIGSVIGVIGAVQQFKEGLPACEAIDTKTFNYKGLDASMDMVTHPMDHFEVLEKDLKVNGISIIIDGAEAAAAYRRGDFFTFGKKMGEILEKSTEKAPEPKTLQSFPADNIDHKMVTEIFQGLLEGTKVGTFNFTNLLICIYEMDQAAMIAYQDVEMIEDAIKNKDYEELIPAAIATVAAVQAFEQGLPVCEQVDTKAADWTTFHQIVDVTESPEKHMELINKDIVMNGKVITKDIMDAYQVLRAGNYRQFGRDFGDILVQATEETPENLFLY